MNAVRSGTVPEQRTAPLDRKQPQTWRDRTLARPVAMREYRRMLAVLLSDANPRNRPQEDPRRGCRAGQQHEQQDARNLRA